MGTPSDFLMHVSRDGEAVCGSKSGTLVLSLTHSSCSQCLLRLSRGPSVREAALAERLLLALLVEESYLGPNQLDVTWDLSSGGSSDELSDS
jgi:hypothetical protein